jgi:ISXO2-like transposase domain
MTGHSKQAVTNFIAAFQDLVGCAIDSDDTVVGGENVVVEIDESKFGKRKYNKGHSVEGVWVLGGVERTSNRLMFAQVVQKRDAKTLMEVISRHVASGSIVHTDLWKAYLQVEDRFNVQHRTVNHSKHFVNPVDGTHTNTIEGTWNGIKLKIAPRNRTKKDMEYRLLEFIWRRIHENDLWGGFMDGLKQIQVDSRH